MSNYDYHDDKLIIEAAAKYDKVSGKKQCEVYYSGEINMPVHFYDMALLEQLYSFGSNSLFSGTEGAFRAYEYVLLDLFRNYNTYIYKSKEDIEWVIKGLQIQLYESYEKRLIEHFKEYQEEKVADWLEIWKDVTIEKIKECFEKEPFSYDIFNKEQDNLNLLFQCLFTTVYNHVTNILHKYHPVPDIILYNFWGFEYNTSVGEIPVGTAPSKEESEKIDHINNMILFTSRFKEWVLDIIQKKSPLSGLRDLLQQLFHDYTILLRINHITDTIKVKQAVKRWEAATLDLINLVIYLQSQQYRLCDYHINDVVHSHVFYSSHRSEWDSIQEIHTKIKSHIHAITYSFVLDIDAGKGTMPWAEELASLGVSIRDMYNLMKGYFWGVPFETFRFCIEAADLSFLQVHILGEKRGGNYGALRYFVVRIGSQCKLWLEAVAKTLKDEKGNIYTARKLMQSVSPQKQYAKELDRVIDEMNINLPR